MPEMPKYDGTSDPQEHISTYTMAVKGNNLAPHEIESVLLKKFGETLTRGALMWYSLLPDYSIDSFEMLADSFIKAHAGARKVQSWKAYILRIAQGESELLREFVTRFQKERMLLTDVHNRYESKIRTEEDHVGSTSSAKGWEKRREKSKDDYDADKRTSRGQFLPYERIEGRGRNFRAANKFIADRGTDRGRNNRSLQDKETSGSRDPSYPKLSKYNFNINTMELVSAMRNIKDARFSRPMRSDSSQRDPNLWCEYHGTNGHRTGDCRHLREEVATLLKNGHLREFLSDQAKNNFGRNIDDAEALKAGGVPTRQTINMIFGGNEINGVTFLSAKKTKVSITHSKRLREDDITFTEKDADGLLLPHNDALVISLNVLDFKFKYVLVDPGSSANII
ncbi:uncharacterized protein [Nicotiana tomentosiformis]|uniref:uncharacterized protein n=1 Tax=Nicotiana tomentosiformis TaxID=4098 RepID=UPI00388CE4BA